METASYPFDHQKIEAHSRIILESIGEGFLAVDADWIITYVNKATEDFTSMPRAELLGKNFWAAFPLALATPSETHYRATAATGEPKTFEVYYEPIDGWCEINCFAIDTGGIAILFRNISGRKQLEVIEKRALEARAIASENAKFRAYFEQCSQFAWLLALDGTVIEANQRSLALAQTTQCPTLGIKFWNCHIWNDFPHMTKAIKNAILAAANGQTFRHEVSYNNAAYENDAVIDLTVNPVADEQGKIVFIAMTGVDVTENYRLDAAFHDAKIRLEATLTAAEVATWAWDIQSNTVIADRNLKKMFSLPESTAQGAPLEAYFDTIHPDDVEHMKSALERAIATGTNFECQYRVQSDDGYRTVVARGKAQYDSAGNPITFPGVAVDITRQVNAERELNLSRDRYSSLIELMDNGFCLIEILFDQNNQPYDYLFLEVNRSFERQTGLVSPTGKTARALVPNLEHSWVESYAQVAITGNSNRFQMHSPAMGRSFDIYASRLGDDNSNIVSLIFSDITEQKIAENELRYQANTLAVSDRRKTEFLATLAHELRNPLAPLRTGLQLLQRAPQNVEQNKNVHQMMERQLAQMIHLVDDLLDIARISNGKIELKTKPAKLSDIVTSAVETSRPMIDSLNHQLVINMHNGSLIVNGDPMRLAQVLSNLLNNSAKYTPPGGSIELCSWDENADIFISVTDTGVGLSNEAIASVFEMFSQVGRSASQSQGGLGIGLSLVQQIIELHGGTVSATSRGPGLGSTFTVQLPRSLVVAKKTHDSAPEPLSTADHTNIRILVVDDNVDAANSLAALLNMAEYRTQVAANGEEAIAAAQTFLPHIAFLDLGLPGMDGYQLAQALKEIPELKDLRMVALTGWGGEEDRLKTKAAGFAEHLIKPTGFDAVQRAINAFQLRSSS